MPSADPEEKLVSDSWVVRELDFPSPAVEATEFLTHHPLLPAYSGEKC
jgi:hypothetical protein